ncbi:MAG: cell division protein FtsZ [Rhodospirillaceae bacterium]|nr:cell division protein FtsZ [Rhodospirillaceae bacterium]
MTINLSVPKTTIEAQLKPRITVVGIGGAGGNAVNNMIQASLEGVDFVVANTDAQALTMSRTDRRIQLGRDMTQGLGAGARPDIGRHAAEESIEAIAREIDGSHMAFITAGMGGGTGTGAAPVIARIAREMGILTVGVVTKPFHFEGANRMRLADAGIEELADLVDTLIVIPNQNLFRVANEKTTFSDAFKMADDVLYGGVRSVTDLIIMPGMINLDFADLRTVMKEMGRAMMGTGEATGDRRALDAAEAAIANPLLEETSMKGAKGVLINITGGNDITLFEVDEAANRIRDEVESDAHIIFGSCFDQSMDGRIRVSVVATGIDSDVGVQPRPMFKPTETRAVGRLMPDTRTAAPAVAKTAAPVIRAPVQPTLSFGTGPGPAPAMTAPSLTPTMTAAPVMRASEPSAEEKVLAKMAAVLKAEKAEMAQAPAPMPEPMVEAAMEEQTMAAAVESVPVIAEGPAPMVAEAAPVAMPQAAQAAALVETLRAAPPVAQPRIPLVTVDRPMVERPQVNVRDTFIPRAPMVATAPAAPMMEPRLAEPKAAAPAPAPAAPAPAPAKAEGSRLSLFSRYRNLTAKKVDETPKAVTEPMKVEKASPAINIAVGPSDRMVSSQSDDELEIPAFLRRQAN